MMVIVICLILINPFIYIRFAAISCKEISRHSSALVIKYIAQKIETNAKQML